MTRPLSCTRRHAFGVPFTTLSESRATGMESANALPDWRWHSVKWHA